jgi:AraC family transcriptional regulator of adaptative response/methylated-DNA-[protein]-cysteine methyltransferase
MLSTLPDHDELYTALVARDPAYEGIAYVGVTTTGIFCRLTCPARKPRRENSVFFPSIAACLEAGYRPCRRCRPLAPFGGADPVIRSALSALEADPARRWREQDVRELGLDPSTLRRAFKRYFGMTFLELARLYRLRSAGRVLAERGSVIEAQQAGGFESGSGFRTAFARVLGRAPGSFSGDEPLRADWIESPIGAMVAVADTTHLHLLEFFDRRALPTELNTLQRKLRRGVGIGRFEPIEQIESELGRYFDGEPAPFETPQTWHGSEFTRAVWSALQGIPPGETRSYADIAREVDRPNAVRAVARANGANQLALIVPCHRVIGSDGSLTGYGGGLWRKQWLIDHERRLGARSATSAGAVTMRDFEA